MLIATVVAILTCLAVANATQTITTPNAVKITYNLAASANSAPITPASNTSVLVMGCCITSGDIGAGQVTLIHSPGAYLEWAGYESYAGVEFTGNFSSMAGNHILYINAVHTVEIQVASADTIRIHNGASTARAGSVTIIW
jgi:hypothetical protein